jgi:hypothetical protein
MDDESVRKIREDLLKKHCFALLEKRKRKEKRNTMPIDYDLSCVYFFSFFFLLFKFFSFALIVLCEKVYLSPRDRSI